MRRRAELALFACLLSLPACGSYREDLETICFAPERAPGAEETDPAKRARRIGEYTESKVRTRRGKDLVKSWETATPGTVVEALRLETSQQGITRCPFADELTERTQRIRSRIGAVGGAP